MATDRKCVTCGTRPRPKDGSRTRCRPCQVEFNNQAKAQKDKSSAKRKADPRKLSKYSKLYYWKTHLVGHYTGVEWDKPLIDQRPILVKEKLVYLGDFEPEDAPQCRRLVNLNEWCELPRWWVKRFKSSVRNQPLMEGQALSFDGSFCEA
jgi:hypothetical protein